MPEKSWTIGSDSSCDLVVNSNTVSGRHCRLTRDGIEWTLTDLESTNGTYVNGEQLLGSRSVMTTDSITLGQSQSMPWPENANASAESEDKAKTAMTKSGTSISIGRGPNNDIVLRDSNVSMNHARLIIGGSDIVLEDLGSTNGTSIGSVENKVSRGTIERTDTVFFGSTSFRVSDLLAQSQPSQVPPTIRSKSDSGPKSSTPDRLVSLALAGGSVLVLLFGLGWLLTHEPNETELVQANIPSPVSGVPESAVATDTVKATREEPQDASAATVPAEVALSPEEKTARSVFLIVCSDVQRETPFRVGNGFAIDSNTVVTSASVIQAMRNLQQNGFPEVFLFSPANESELQIVSTVLHPQFEKADETAKKAQRTHDAIFDQLESEPPKPEAFEAVKDQLIAARMEAFEAMDQKATYDVAVINTTASLDHWLPEVSATTKLRPKQKVNVAGYAFDMEDPFFDRDVPFELATMSGRIAQVVTEPSSSADRLVADGGPEQHESAYLGSPVLNAQGQVVGVYSRPTPPVLESEDAPVQSFDAALFIRVHECRKAQQAL